jgi:hypothetical protein
MTEGFISFAIRIPSTNSFAVILCNSSPTDFFGLIENLVKVMYNKSVILKQPVHKKTETNIAELGAAKAVEEYKKNESRFGTLLYRLDIHEFYCRTVIEFKKTG